MLAPTSLSATTQTPLTALEKAAKQSNITATFALVGYHKSCIDKTYKILWPSSIKLLEEHGLVQAFMDKQGAYAQVPTKK